MAMTQELTDDSYHLFAAVMFVGRRIQGIQPLVFGEMSWIHHPGTLGQCVTD